MVCCTPIKYNNNKKRKNLNVDNNKKHHHFICSLFISIYDGILYIYYGLYWHRCTDLSQKRVPTIYSSLFHKTITHSYSMLILLYFQCFFHLFIQFLPLSQHEMSCVVVAVADFSIHVHFLFIRNGSDVSIGLLVITE